MSEIGYHSSLDALCAAAALTHGGLQCLCVPLAAPGEAAWDQLRGPAKRAHQRFVWRQHTDLVARVSALPPDVPILVREFSTLPLAMLSRRFRPFRDRLLFLVNHNLQWAVRSAPERLAFRALNRAGFHFVFFETLDLEPLRRWGFRSGSHAAIPLPVETPPPVPRPRADGPWRIGLAGQYRLEKGMEPALRSLLESSGGRIRPRLGIPNPDEFFRVSPLADRRAGFDWEDTSDPARFRRFLSDCDAILLNYDPAAYAYRPSGLMADAAACGTPVVLPDLPVQRVQVSAPVPVGEVRRDGESWPEAVIRVAAAGRAGSYDFAAYARARSREALAGSLDRIVREVLRR